MHKGVFCCTSLGSDFSCANRETPCSVCACITLYVGIYEKLIISKCLSYTMIEKVVKWSLQWQWPYQLLETYTTQQDEQSCLPSGFSVFTPHTEAEGRSYSKEGCRYEMNNIRCFSCIIWSSAPWKAPEAVLLFPFWRYGLWEESPGKCCLVSPGGEEAVSCSLLPFKSRI